MRPQNTFVPNDLQRLILDALEGVAMTVDMLEAAVGVARDTLYGDRKRRGGLKELMDRGIVLNDRRIGGYTVRTPAAEFQLKNHFRGDCPTDTDRELGSERSGREPSGSGTGNSSATSAGSVVGANGRSALPAGPP